MLGSRAMNTKWMTCLFLAGTLAITACGTDAADPTECSDGLSYDPVQGTCVRLSDGPIDNGPMGRDAGFDQDTPAQDVSLPGVDVDSPDQPTAEPDTGVEMGPPDLGCVTDDDGDGALSMACGGDDCDDSDARRAPGLSELCDEVDNNCDGVVNEDLDCSLFAHSDTRLYKLDIFQGTSVDLGATVSNLWDIDTHPDGTLYGIADGRLYAYANATGWTAKPNELGLGFLEEANGFCIDNNGTAYLTTNGFGNLRTVDLVSGSSTEVGALQPESSSGDCVVSKGNVLYMTSNASTPDSFVKLNGAAPVSPMRVGMTGHDSIWGLTAAWNRIFGLTGAGEVVEIDAATGQTTLIHQYPGLAFYGAASTPAR